MSNFKSIDIAKFINKNADSNSIKRSFSIYPVLKSINNKQAVYECQGSARKPYTVKIFTDDILSVQCSCPYDFGGICKHSVASLESFALTLKNFEGVGGSTKNSTSNKITTVNSSEIFSKILYYPVENHIISVEKIKDDLLKGKSGYYSNLSSQIESINPSTIKTKTQDWGKGVIQTFEYDKVNLNLKIQCSCSEKKYTSYCHHLPTAFDKIINVFGKDYFQENYFENKKEQYLKEYGLNLKDDYEKYFSFKLDIEGFKALNNFPNLQKTSKPLESKLSQELKIKNKKEIDSNFGNALIFDFSKKQLLNLTPVSAKFNKEGTELATHFKEIYIYNIEREINNYDEKTFSIFLLASKISEFLDRFNSNKKAIYLKDSINVFKKIKSLLTGFPLFAHQINDTYAKKNLEELIIIDEEPKLLFNFSEDSLFYTLEPKLKIGNQSYNLNSTKIVITPIFIKKENEIFPINNPIFAADLLYYLEIPECRYIKKNAGNFQQNVLQPLSEKYEINTKNIIKEKEKIEDKNYLKQVFIEDDEDSVAFKLALQYPEKLIDIDSNEIRFKLNNEGQFSYVERDTEAEERFRNEFENFHPDFQSQNGEYFLEPKQLVENYWFLEVAEQMKNSGIELLGLKNLKSFKYNLNKPSISYSVKSDLDWFDVNIDISFGDQKLSLKDLQKAFVKKSNYIVLSDGSIGILPEEWMKKFANYFKVGEIKKDALQISNFQFGIIDELYQELEEKPEFLINLYEKKQRIQNISNILPTPIPKGIKAKMRDYQHHGLNWLNFLDENQLGGCLADDMGLGKTLQTIAFLQHLKVTKKPKLPSLIIAPTSLIFNWEQEISKFCPTLKLHVFTGANRFETLEKFKKSDLVITTYGSLLNDIEDLKEMEFNYIILDESQAIKNPTSKRYKSVRLLKAYNRIALTGTPIENNTFDLYAQFNFLNPGLLGNISHFKKEFSDAIDKEKEVSTSELLAKIIHPFILRRTKEQVATELPDKIENIIYCEMEKEQRKVYDTFKNHYRDYLLNKIDENGIAKSQMYVLEGLMKLRQICNSPAIISDKEDYGNASIKLEILMENIKEKTGNHKILIFSSFVKMLQLIKNKLEEESITYEYLDGQTRDRQSRVENFQNKKDVRVFLISTKAGGTGLNLTEADYVFIVDPWWNPAVENQAIDRCYRIGQKKQVMAYRMICKDTIEEKIVALQNKKKGIATSIISVDEESKSFDAQEIKDLFA